MDAAARNALAVLEELLTVQRSTNLTLIERQTANLKHLHGIEYPASHVALPLCKLSMIEACVREQLNDVLNMFLDKRLGQVDVCVGYTCTALCRACYQFGANIGMIKILLFFGSDPNATISNDGRGVSCLMTSVMTGNRDAAELMLGYGADIAYEWKGQNALSMAVDFQHTEIVEVIENSEMSFSKVRLEMEKRRTGRVQQDPDRQRASSPQPLQPAPLMPPHALMQQRLQDTSAFAEEASQDRAGVSPTAAAAQQLCVQDSGVDFEKTLSRQSILTSQDLADMQAIDWVYATKDVEIGKRLGSGGFGSVYKARLVKTGDLVACKIVSCSDSELLGVYKAELMLLSRFRHENVVLFLGAVVDLPQLCILTELMECNLYDRLKRSLATDIPWTLRIKWCRDVCKAMNYLHTRSPPVVHRDLKSLNILLDEYDRVKLCDFGLSQVRHHSRTASDCITGSPAWMAPEALRGETFTTRSDVYSFSVLLWEILTRKAPWQGKHMPQIVGLVGFSGAHLELPSALPPQMPPEYPHLLTACRSEPPSRRPSFRQLVADFEALFGTLKGTPRGAAPRNTPLF